MAELKELEDYQYDFPLEVEESEASDLTETLLIEEEIVLPSSPARRLKHVSTVEKLIVVMLMGAAIGLSLLTIQIRTQISTTEKNITTIQADTADNREEAAALEQQKSELSRTDRVKEIAEKKGLIMNDDNLRNVK